IITGRAEYNPAPDIAIALAVPKPKHNPFLSVEELPYFIGELEAYSGSIITKNATQIVMLTGVRTQEMRFATWEEVDLDKEVWEIPAERMKMR
ncbi:tyrosine-type recombinase/integrase, partial [Klebsiella pneumoniae]|uniref:tyrosine-type recombinase/integrase n=1 Tax=Klebsiella pneumoniae TaxID=573 RepID=UPI00200C650D